MPGLDQALAAATRWITSNLLVDTVRVTLPPSGPAVLDPVTGRMTYPAGETLYEGAGAVLPTTAGDANAVPGAGQQWAQETSSRYRLLTPLEAPIPPKDAIVTVVGVHDTGNAALIGRRWICLDPGLASTVEVVRSTPIDQQSGAVS